MRFALCVEEFDTPEETVAPLLRLAESAGASIDIVHVLLVSTSTGEAWSGSHEQVRERVGDQLDETRDQALRELSVLESRLAVPARVAILAGTNVAQTILKYCDEEQVDLIALASHNPGDAPGEARLGSVANDVVLGATSPVYLLYPFPKSGSEIDPVAFAKGSFVFSSDGVELGVVAEVKNNLVRISGDDHEDWWLPKSTVAGAVSGRTELHHTRAAIEELAVSPPAR